MLPPHALKIVLVEPAIAQKTGNIARLCAATGTRLHLVRPLGFFLSDRHFKRAGMDYLSSVPIIVHDGLAALFVEIGDEPIALSSGLTGRPHWSVSLDPRTWIFLGRESAGLPAELLAAHRARIIPLPMLAGTRGLNLSTAAGILVYEALRQIDGVH